MYYAIMGSDREGSLEARKASRPEHLARLQALLNEGRLLVAGPHPAIDAEDPGDSGFTGSLIVASFESLGDARAWANEDPYLAAGVYRDVVVKPFRKVLP
ncbi:MAG: YciI family protein [Pseudomonadota bacterium]